MPKTLLKDRLANDFTYHPPTPAQVTIYEAIRGQAHELASILIDEVPVGRELSLALTKLEEAVFWANAGIARAATRPDG